MTASRVELRDCLRSFQPLTILSGTCHIAPLGRLELIGHDRESRDGGTPRAAVQRKLESHSRIAIDRSLASCSCFIALGRGRSIAKFSGNRARDRKSWLFGLKSCFLLSNIKGSIFPHVFEIINSFFDPTTTTRPESSANHLIFIKKTLHTSHLSRTNTHTHTYTFCFEEHSENKMHFASPTTMLTMPAPTKFTNALLSPELKKVSEKNSPTSVSASGKQPRDYFTRNPSSMSQGQASISSQRSSSSKK